MFFEWTQYKKIVYCQKCIIQDMALQAHNQKLQFEKNIILKSNISTRVSRRTLKIDDFKISVYIDNKRRFYIIVHYESTDCTPFGKTINKLIQHRNNEWILFAAFKNN